MGKKGPLGAIFLVAGTGFFLVTGYLLVDANLIAANGVAAEATVISVDENRSRRGRRTYAPVYRFVDRNGQTFTGQ